MELMMKENGMRSLEHQKLMEKEFGPEFQKKMELMMKENGKIAIEHQRLMEKEFGPEFQKKMELMGEGIARDMAKRSKEMEVRVRGMQDREAVAKVRAGQSIQVKDGVILRTKDGKTETLRPGKDGTIRLADGTVIRTFGDDRNRSIAVEVRAGRQAIERVRVVRGEAARANAVDAKKFLNTLTPDQKQSQRMRGHVLYMDLTKEQKALLGKVPSGKFEIKLKVNDQEVVVRGL
jgi:hypothetical protein